MLDETEQIRLEIEAPLQLPAGAPIPVVLRLRNTGDAPRVLYLRGRTLTFDLVVTDADGRIVWRRLEGAVIPAIVRLRELAPGETLRVRARWDGTTAAGPAPPGRYAIQGIVLTDREPHLRSPTATVEIAAA